MRQVSTLIQWKYTASSEKVREKNWQTNSCSSLVPQYTWYLLLINIVAIYTKELLAITRETDFNRWTISLLTYLSILSCFRNSAPNKNDRWIPNGWTILWEIVNSARKVSHEWLKLHVQRCPVEKDWWGYVSPWASLVNNSRQHDRHHTCWEAQIISQELPTTFGSRN